MDRDLIVLILVIVIALVVAFSLLYMWWNSLGPFQMQIEGLTPGALQKARTLCAMQCTTIGGSKSLTVELEITGDGITDTVDCATGGVIPSNPEGATFIPNWGTFNTNTCKFGEEAGGETTTTGGGVPGF